jgi:streptomycin 6-kinase
VSEENIERWNSVYGDQAREWLGKLAIVVSDYAERWDLTIEEPLEGGTVSAVIGVLQDDEPAVLKIHPPWTLSSLPLRTTAEIEATAFEIWDGRGAPRLLAHDKHALLLERIVGAKHSPEMDANSMTKLITQISRPVPRSALAQGIPLIQYEIREKRYERAAARRHPEISDCLLMNACGLAGYIALLPLPDRLNFPYNWELIHGDLKVKNILQRPDSSYVVIDPSPAIGNRLFDATLWTIDKPEGIAERCEEVADCLEINPRIVGNLAIALAIPEICLASPERAAATLEYVREATGTRDLESYFFDNATTFDWTNQYYIPQDPYKYRTRYLAQR